MNGAQATGYLETLIQAYPVQSMAACIGLIIGLALWLALNLDL